MKSVFKNIFWLMLLCAPAFAGHGEHDTPWGELVAFIAFCVIYGSGIPVIRILALLLALLFAFVVAKYAFLTDCVFGLPISLFIIVVLSMVLYVFLSDINDPKSIFKKK